MANENLPKTSGVEYRIVNGLSDYAVGDDGTVWSKRKGPWKKLNPLVRHHGYLYVCLFGAPGERFNFRVSRLVLTTFVGPCPNGYQACHFPDDDRANNRLANLRWDTPKENLKDIKRCGKRRRNRTEKLTTDQIILIREQYASGKMSLSSLGRMYEVNKTAIHKIVTGVNWTDIGGPVRSRKRKEEHDSARRIDCPNIICS